MSRKCSHVEYLQVLENNHLLSFLLAAAYTMNTKLVFVHFQYPAQYPPRVAFTL